MAVLLADTNGSLLLLGILLRCNGMWMVVVLWPRHNEWMGKTRLNGQQGMETSDEMDVERRRVDSGGGGSNCKSMVADDRNNRSSSSSGSEVEEEVTDSSITM